MPVTTSGEIGSSPSPIGLIGSTLSFGPWVLRTRKPSWPWVSDTTTRSLPRPVFSQVVVRTPVRLWVPSTVMPSAPDPVQIRMPSASVPVDATFQEMPAGASPTRKTSAEASSAASRARAAAATSVSSTEVSPTGESSSLTRRVCRPVPRSRLRVPWTRSRSPARNCGFSASPTAAFDDT